MIVTGEFMVDQLSDRYSSPACKLSRMVDDGEIVRLKRGLYETDPSTPAYLVANAIYGPSYISFEYALARYDIIPEFVTVVTSATYGKRKEKYYKTPIGRFRCMDVPEAAFPVGITTYEQNGREYLMATKEKAVCDKLYKMPPVNKMSDFDDMMFDDLRFDESIIDELDYDEVSSYAKLYRSTNVRMLKKYLEGSA